MIKFFLYLILFLYLIFFGFNNNQEINLIFIPNIFEINTKSYIAAFLLFLTGYFACFCLYGTKIISLKWSNYKQNKKIKFLQKEQNYDKMKKDHNSKELLDNHALKK